MTRCLCRRKVVETGFSNVKDAVARIFDLDLAGGREGPSAEIWLESDLFRLQPLHNLEEVDPNTGLPEVYRG